ncbi:MAG: hypothetical protein K2I40_01485 [Bifidobacterium castoris]|nr:hypothetical protein [Bifidobacterium castoris]
MTIITCRPLANDWQGTAFVLEVSQGPLSWSRDLWDIDLEDLLDLADARLNGRDAADTPNWRNDKYPDQQHPDLYERRAPAFRVNRGADDRWLVTIEDDSSMTVNLSGEELSASVQSMRSVIDNVNADLMLSTNLSSKHWDGTGHLIR